MPAPPLTEQHSALHRNEAEALAVPFFPHLGELEPVGLADLPPAYQTLLGHEGHMTVTLEAWHESLMDVRVVGEHAEGSQYARHSLLARQSDGRVVQSGVMRIDLAGLPPEVQQRVAAGGCPLGRILIRSNLLREVELLALWRITPGEQLAAELQTDAGEVIYGRCARIIVENRNAVELLEIVKP
ncbi:hypothetical protein [Botrimarina hoheduenensis]|uniref:Uncharacterized protein n=1 Tax=Botrimarina hoheduenensis TaxID=2528000 RepID=A0A5C5VYW9_9BACT|nr:hypothetical protein [Botrimarina hoheduenensis]TWT43297.1 hypothetical protein Pla111_22480 [Botrimarina hoheduenensis]